MPEMTEQLLTDIDARAFFQGAVQSAVVNQNISVSGETIVYLGNLLTSFINSDQLFEKTPDGVVLKSLAMHYLEALQACTIKERHIMLRRLGDVSLFISGMFADSLNRSHVDIDYYISMGGNAYSYLSETGRPVTTLALQIVFSELAENFTEMTDVLSEVGETAHLTSSHDVLRLYEIWQKTGSRRAAGKLEKAGIHPVRTGIRQH